MSYNPGEEIPQLRVENIQTLVNKNVASTTASS